MKPFLRNLISICTLALFSGPAFSQNSAVLVFKTDTAFSHIQKIKVEGQFSKIGVDASSDQQVYLSGTLSSDMNDPAYQIMNQVVGNELIVSIKFPAQGWRTHSGELNFKIPKGLTLDIVTTSGKVILNQLQEVTANVITQSGSIEISKVNGKMKIETVTGAIKATECASMIALKSKTGNQSASKIQGTISASSTEGEIRMNEITGTIKGESTTGLQDYDKIQGDISTKSAAGSVKISNITGNVAVITFSGGIKIFNTKGLVNLQSTAGDQVGTRILLTGSSSFKSTEGKIKMQIDNNKEELTYMLKSTVAYLQAAGQSKKKSLKAGKGAIIVTGESTTGGQVYN